MILLLSFMFGFTAKAPLKTDFPIVMYHSVCNMRNNDYVVSTAQLESDIKYILGKGYTPIFISQAINYVEGRENPIKKPIAITFDDGFYNNYTLVLPILKKYNVKATVSLVGKYSETEQARDYRHNYFSYLRYDEVREMAESGLIEFGNHSYDMHKLSGRRGVGKAAGESEEQYRKNLQADARRCENLYKEKCGLKFGCFTYPYGSFGKNTAEYLSQLGYKAFLTCIEGSNFLEIGNMNCLRELKRFNRPSKYNSEYFFTHICKLSTEEN